MAFYIYNLRISLFHIKMSWTSLNRKFLLFFLHCCCFSSRTSTLHVLKQFVKFNDIFDVWFLLFFAISIPSSFYCYSSSYSSHFLCFHSSIYSHSRVRKSFSSLYGFVPLFSHSKLLIASLMHNVQFEMIVMNMCV